MIQRIKEWLEIRIGLEDLIRSQLTEYRVPKNINIFYTLGIVAFVGYLTQIITGIFLLFYYVPLAHDNNAFKSVQFIMNTVPYGWLFRLVHVVGSNLMVAVVFLHLFSVFFLQAYKKPRELTWVIGALLLIVTLTFCLSGYLLPWSQLSYWATTIVTYMPSAFPVLGTFIVKLLRGGEQISDVTLTRFLALHVAFLPPLMMALFGLHIFLVRRIGISSPPFGKGVEEQKVWKEYKHKNYLDGFPFYPDFVSKEFFVIVLYFVVMFCIITFAPSPFLPEDANTPADPFSTPEHIRPEWYFRAPYLLLRLVPNKFLGILLQLILIIVFILWPFFDRADKNNILKRPFLLALFLGSLTVWIGFTIWGSF